MEKTYENSLKASWPIKEIMQASQKLDIEYLKGALKDMEESLSWKISASVMDPDPMTMNQRHDLEACKNEQLRIIISLGENVKKMKQLTIDLHGAEAQKDQFKKLFGS
jgi:hypothetical protein